MPHVPPVRRVEIALRPARRTPACRRLRARRSSASRCRARNARRSARRPARASRLGGERLGPGQGLGARQRDVEIDERDRQREELPGDRRARAPRAPRRRSRTRGVRVQPRSPPCASAHDRWRAGVRRAPRSRRAPPAPRSRRRRARAARAARRPCARRAAAARARSRGIVAENLIGVPTCGTVPASGCGRSIRKPRAASCGSANT